jgi:hypothetical protein
MMTVGIVIGIFLGWQGHKHWRKLRPYLFWLKKKAQEGVEEDKTKT